MVPFPHDLHVQKNTDPAVKLYTIEILKYQESVPALLPLLTNSERQRAHRYHFTKDKNRFIICRALLKFILAEHTGLKVDNICIEVNSNKKPYLASDPSVYFNISHSVDYAIIAIAKNPVGVDVEHINRNFSYTDIVPTVCHQSEIKIIENSNDPPLNFYKFWTRKEALVKAIGKGLDDDISKISATDGPHHIESSLVGHFKNICVLSFTINDHYLGAIAITSVLNRLEEISFQPLPKEIQLKTLLS